MHRALAIPDLAHNVVEYISDFGTLNSLILLYNHCWSDTAAKRLWQLREDGKPFYHPKFMALAKIADKDLDRAQRYANLVDEIHLGVINEAVCESILHLTFPSIKVILGYDAPPHTAKLLNSITSTRLELLTINTRYIISRWSECGNFFARLKAVESLSIGIPTGSDQWASRLGKLDIKSLEVNAGNNRHDELVWAILQNESLLELEFNTVPRQPSLDGIRSLLKSLKLDDCTPQALSILKACPELEELSLFFLNDCLQESSALEYVAQNCPNLRSFDVSSHPTFALSMPNVINVAKSLPLTTLCVEFFEAEGDEVVEDLGLPSFDELEFEPEHCAALVNACPQLKHLNLACAINYNNFAQLLKTASKWRELDTFAIGPSYDTRQMVLNAQQFESCQPLFPKVRNIYPLLMFTGPTCCKQFSKTNFPLLPNFCGCIDCRL